MKKCIFFILINLNFLTTQAQQAINLNSTTLTDIPFFSPDSRTRSTRLGVLPFLSSGAVAVSFTLKGGDGGIGTWDGIFTDLIAQGGEGGSVTFTLPLTTANEGGILKFYQGKAGESYIHPNLASGGGGGSSAITLVSTGGIETLIAVAAGAGGGCATEITQSSGYPGGIERDGKEIFCRGGFKGSQPFPSGRIPSFATVDDIIFEGTGDNDLFYRSGNGGGITQGISQNPALHQNEIRGKAASAGGLGGIRPAVIFFRGDISDCDPDNPFSLGCRDVITLNISAGGAGYSGGGAGGHWFEDLGQALTTESIDTCGGIFPYGGGGGGAGYYSGGGGGNQSGGGGGSSYTNNSLVANAILTEGSTTSIPQNGFVQYRVILDNEAPVAVCQDRTISIGNNGALTNSSALIINQGPYGVVNLQGSDIDGGSTDDGEIVSRTASITNFNCSNLGTTTAVTLTVTDFTGNSDSCTAQVSIVDIYPPSITGATNAIINTDPNYGNIDLGTNTSMTITPPTLTFTDNCSLASVQQAQAFTVTCADVGQPIYKEVIATDTSGNENRLVLEYNVLDQTPIAICQDITVSLGPNGEAVSIAAADVGSGSDPVCSSDMTLSIDKDTFTCADLGENTVTLTATNANTGNSTTCIATVSVVLNSNPITLYVNQNTPNDGDGRSWANAFSSLESALALQDCNIIDEIRVASGVYEPTTSRKCIDCTSIGDPYFLIHSDLALKGGYNPSTNTQNSSQPSILRGENFVFNVTSDNLNHILIATNLSNAATIDGFSIREGNANETGAISLNIEGALVTIPRNSGGGLYLSNSNPNINNVIIYDNLTSGDGAGMTNDASNPRLTNVLFTQNVAQGTGSAIYNKNGGKVTIVNNTIVGNTANNGATFYTDPSILSRSIFYNTVMYNNVQAGNDVQGVQPSTASANNFAQNYIVTGFITLVTDPFINSSIPAGVDGVFGTTDDGLVPVFQSVIYNAGNSSNNSLAVDLAGQTRVQGASIEVGAYETDDPCNVFSSGIIYVDASASGTGSGFDWTNAFSSLNDALLFQTQCVNITEIRVASGTYTPTTSRNCSGCSGSRDFYFLLDRNVIFKGSYNTVTGLQEYSNPSVLSGDIGISGSSSDNTYHVLITRDLNTTSIIDGFEISGGNANGFNNIFIQPNPAAVISRQSGGGLYNYRSDPNISNTAVIGNSAAFDGGGIYNQVGSDPSLLHVLVINNSSNSAGGGIGNTQSSPIIINSLVYGNSSPNGGGMFNQSSSSPIVHNSVFYANGTDIFNFNASVNGISSNNFAQNFGGTGFALLGVNPFSNSTDIDGADNILRTVDDGLRPFETSPLVDAGDSNKNTLLKDITGQNRVSGTAIDVGPYEIAQASDYFVTTWQTTGANEGITIPTFGTGYKYNVDWDNDGIFDDLGVTGNVTHVYVSAGIHTITIAGDFPRIYVNNAGDKDKILTVEQWGIFPWTSMGGAFFGCSNLTVNAIDTPNLTSVTDMSKMFALCTSFNSDISSWDVSHVINLEGLFEGADNFNQPLGTWDVSKVTNMLGIFKNATAFNQNLSTWDVKNVTDMAQLFDNATAFDQSLGNWDISSVTSMNLMFNNVTLSTENYDNILIDWFTLSTGEFQIPQNVPFDGGNSMYCLGEAARTNLINNYGWTITDGGLVTCTTDFFVTTWQTTTANEILSIPTEGTGYSYDIDWDGDNIFDAFGITGNATHTYPTAGTYTVQIRGDFPRIFFNNTGNKDKILSIEQWGDIAWTSMESAFKGCTNLLVNAVDAPNLSNVSTLNSMFNDCTSLNQALLNWDVSNVTDMAFLFFNATSFNQDISYWDVDNVIDMTGMFAGSAFDQSIGNWNLSNVTNISGMFANSPFNQAIGNWDVSSVTRMFATFLNNTAFNQPIDAWDVKNVTDMGRLFDGATSFDQNIGSWDISSVEIMLLMFNAAKLSTENYDNTLIGWSTLDAGETQIPTNIFFNAGNSNYCLGETARTNLINTNAWTITDAGLNCSSCLDVARYTTSGWTGTPGSNTLVVIETNYNANVSGTFEACELIVNEGVSLDVGGETITVKGDVANNGIMSAIAGTLVLNGDEAQLLSGNDFQIGDLVIENSSLNGVILQNNIEIINRLDLISGPLDTNSGSLTFNSDASKTAVVDIVGSGSLVGEVTVERYIPAGDNNKRAFRFLSSSVSSTESIRANWQEGVNNTATSFPTDNQNPSPGFGTHISGSLTGANGFDATGSGDASLFLYPINSQSWVPIDNTDVNTLAAGAAYRLMVRGDRSINLTTNAASPSNTKLRATGNLAFGELDMSANLAQGADEFSFVGNPYQAVVDFGLVTKTNLRDYLYIWDASLTGSSGRGAYVVVEVSSNSIVDAPAASSSSATQFIAPNQAFFVRNTSAGNPILVFQEANKTIDEAQVTVFNTSSTFYINSRLYKTVDLQNGQTEADALGLRFDENFTTIADEEDAEKLGNPDENYAIINNGLRVIDKQNLPTQGHEIDLFVNNYTTTEYSLTFELGNQPEGINVSLYDEFLETTTPISQQGNSVYAFSVDASIPASTAFSRFSLVFDNETFSNDVFDESPLSLYPNPTRDVFYISGLTTTAEVEVFDILGRTVLVKQQIANQQGINIGGLPSGVYIVKVKEGEHTYNSKIIKK